MAVRPTMTALISRLRNRVGDVAGANQAFSDQELQDALDVNRSRAQNLELLPMATFGSGYLDFRSEFDAWEEAATFIDATDTVVTPDTSDYASGWWSFNTEPDYPIYLTGWTYDLHAAAADILTTWSTRLAATHFDVTADNDRLQRSQLVTQLRTAAKDARANSRVTRLTMTREY